MQTLVRQNLENIIQTVAYPKQVFTFTITVVHEHSDRPYSHLLPACLNACIALLNQSAIA